MQKKKASPKPKKQDIEFDFDSLKSDSSVPSSPNITRTPQATPSAALKRTSSVRSTEKPKVAEKTPKVPAVKRKATNESEPEDAAEQKTADLPPIKKPRKAAPPPVTSPRRNEPLPEPTRRSAVSESAKQKSPRGRVEASSAVFGFIGLGLLGRNILHNLLEAGHEVVIYNRTTARCEEFVERYGALCVVAFTPKEVFEQAQITFVCVSDSEAVKMTIMDGANGVMAADSQTADKGLVMLSSIDCETSRDVSGALMMKGIRYLEAQVQGSRNQAKDGSLIIIASGDQSLFDDCKSCFAAIAEHSRFLEEGIEAAVKMNHVLQTLAGVQLAAVSEALALADSFGLQLRDIMEIIDISNLHSPFIMEKGDVIINEKFRDASMKVNTMQKDLKMAIDFGDSLQQPLTLVTASNEIFKTAKRMGYGRDDIASIYLSSTINGGMGANGI